MSLDDISFPTDDSELFQWLTHRMEKILTLPFGATDEEAKAIEEYERGRDHYLSDHENLKRQHPDKKDRDAAFDCFIRRLVSNRR